MVVSSPTCDPERRPSVSSATSSRSPGPSSSSRSARTSGSASCRSISKRSGHRSPPSGSSARARIFSTASISTRAAGSATATGVVVVMAWSSMASPTLFAVVGDALPRERRAVGFTVQSILRRIPIAVAPTLGGLAIAAYGVIGGVHLGLALTVGLAAITLVAIRRIDIPVARDEAPTNVVAVWRSLPAPLRWLLASDIFVRTCEGLVDVFLVLYAIDVVGISAPAYGILIGVQAVTAIVSYLPVARLADRIGRKPF